MIPCRMTLGDGPRTCQWCEESIALGEWTVQVPHLGGPDAPKYVYFHGDCLTRHVTGPVEHLLRPNCDGQCRDDPRLTKREAATAAAKLFREQMKSGIG